MKKNYLVKVWVVRVLSVLFWALALVLAGLFVRADFFAPSRAITVLSWSGTMDRALLKKFEAETGIRVFFNSYATNEELLVKLRATGGAGYDLIVPSDYAVLKLVDEGLIKKIDKSRCSFWDKLNPVLLGLYFDPKNDYSIPFGWDLYCVGINKRRIDSSKIKNGWDLIFPARRGDVPPGRQVVMTNDPLEAMLFVYAGTTCCGEFPTNIHDIYSWSPERRKELYVGLLTGLREQRKHLEAYATVRADYFLGMGYVDAAIMQTTDLFRAVKTYDNIDFVVPSPTFVTVENCVIPAACKKDELVYTFLNFLYRHDVAVAQFAACPTAPARSDVFESVAISPRYRELMTLSRDKFQRYLFIRDPFPEYVRYDLWVAVKS